MRGIFPTLKEWLFGPVPPDDEMTARLRTRRLQAWIGALSAYVLPAAVIIWGMVDDESNKRAVALFASVTALTTAGSALVGWYWGAGLIDNKTISGRPPGDPQ